MLTFCFLLLTKTHRLFHSDGKLVLQLLERFVGWQIQTVEAVRIC